MDRIPNSSWKRIYNKLKSQINNAYLSDDIDMYPEFNDIERLASLAEKGFKGSKFFDYVMHESFKLREDYIKKRNSTIRKLKDKEMSADYPAEPSGAEKISLDEEVAANFKNVINKIASDFDIESSDRVIINFNNNGALIKFDGISHKKAFDWSNAIINKATDLFSDLPIVSNEYISLLYDKTKSALDINFYDSPDKKRKYSEFLEDVFEMVMEDPDLYQLINKTSKRLGASKEVTFLKMLEEERNIRNV